MFNAQILKDNHPEVYDEGYNKGFAAGRADAIADAVLEKRKEQKTVPSGTFDMKAESEENKRILANLK
jgi:hypothetical protein